MATELKNKNLPGAAGETSGSGLPGTAATGEAPKMGNSWKDLLKNRKQDLNTDDDAAVGDYLQGEFNRLDEGDRVTKRMNDMIMNGDRESGMLNGLFYGKNDDGSEFNLTNYIIENWYDELKEAVNSQDAIDRVSAKIAAQEEEAKKDADTAKEIEANFKKMDEDFGKAMQQTGIDNQTAGELIDWLYGSETQPGLNTRIIGRSLTEDDFVKLIYAFTREGELGKARQEGRNSGRNTRPGQTHRSSLPAQTDLGGGSGTGEEEEEDENPTASQYRSMRPRFA